VLGCGLLSALVSEDAWLMGLPSEPVTLNAEQLGELYRKLSNMSHDIRNSLSLIVASAELIKARPELFEKMMPRISEAPTKIQASVEKFRTEFEQALGITKS
jgi:signal transduction histidine kinase